MIIVLTTLAGYLLGSVPWALLVGRWSAGVDVRQHGSGNLGATNVFRVLGPRAGTAVLLLDMAKGAISVGLAHLVCPGTGEVVAGLAAIVGHVSSPWVGFRGGKGVATAGGAYLALAPLPMAAVLAVWAVLFVTTRFVSVASIGAALALPAGLWIEAARSAHPAPAAVRWIGLLVSILVIARHVPNMKRLAAGRESRARFGRREEGR